MLFLHLAGIFEHTTKSRVLVWQRSVAGYDYEMEYQQTGYKIRVADSFDNIKERLEGDGYVTMQYTDIKG
jgi:hypothetical protein